MKIRSSLWHVALSACMSLVAAPALGQVLYTQNFDVDDTANWTINPGNPDVANPASGPTDAFADVFFDYSTKGIPSAPNSTGGSTRGLFLQANMTAAIFGGFSVSPTGKTFSGDYSLKFDLWSNYVGTFDNTSMGLGGVGVSATGASMLSLFGIQATDTFSNSPGFGDGTYFAGTGDGGSGSDYRVYAKERASSYQVPPVATPLDAIGQPVDGHANYLAGSRNNTAALYATAFPGGNVVPAAQTALYPDTQYGATPAGTMGFVWNQMEVKKAGNVVSWIANGVTLITVDLTNTLIPPTGSNIMFGHGDINSGISTDPNYILTQFTLVDNVRVEAASVVTDADFNNDQFVDGADVVIWQQGLGISDGTATNGDGDANLDGNVTAADLAIWQGKFGGPPASIAAGAAPEPTSAVLALAGLAVLAGRRRGSR